MFSGQCGTCIDKIQFGGTGTKKKACLLRLCRMKILKEEPEKKPAVLKCGLCTEKFDTIFDLENHIFDTHNQVNIIKKELSENEIDADFEQSTWKPLDEPTATKSIKVDRSGKSKYKCSFCGKILGGDQYGNLKRHVKRVHMKTSEENVSLDDFIEKVQEEDDGYVKVILIYFKSIAFFWYLDVLENISRKIVK